MTPGNILAVLVSCIKMCSYFAANSIRIDSSTTVSSMRRYNPNPTFGDTCCKVIGGRLYKTLVLFKALVIDGSESRIVPSRSKAKIFIYI